MFSCELLPSGAKRSVWLLTILHLLESNSRFYFSKTWKLLNLPYEKHKKHRMPLCDRAAQFAPFAALSGYDAMIQEEARFTDCRSDLSEEEIDKLNQQLITISAYIANGRHPTVSVSYFQPDSQKDGGCYYRVTGQVRSVNQLEQTLFLERSDNMEETKTLTIAFSQLQLLEVND